MPSKKHKPEEIIGKLREVEIVLAHRRRTSRWRDAMKTRRINTGRSSTTCQRATRQLLAGSKDRRFEG